MKLIEVSDDLFDLIGTRTEDGRRLTYSWGEPVAQVQYAGGVVDVYAPTITQTDDGKIVIDRPKGQD